MVVVESSYRPNPALENCLFRAADFRLLVVQVRQLNLPALVRSQGAEEGTGIGSGERPGGGRRFAKAGPDLI